MGGLELSFLGILGRGLGLGGHGWLGYPVVLVGGLELGGLVSWGWVSWEVLGASGSWQVGLDLWLGSWALGVGEFEGSGSLEE